MIITVNPQVVEKCCNYFEANSDQEHCFVLLGQKTSEAFIITDAQLVTNVSQFPRSRYIPDPQEFMNILQHTSFIDKSKPVDFLGIYHNHPDSPAIPSRVDIQGTGYAGVYPIYSNKTKTTAYYYVNKTKGEWTQLNLSSWLEPEELEVTS